MKNALRFTIVLGLITIASGLGVSAVYTLTKHRIEAKKEKAFASALNSVFPQADTFNTLDGGGAWEGEGVGAAIREDETVGYLAVGERQGYSSTIRVLVGAETDFTVKAVRILEQAETPGLGERTKEVKTDRTIWQAAGEALGVGEAGGSDETLPWFQKQFAGLTLEKLVVVKDASSKGVQAITGATVSSQAVTDAVRAALTEIKSAVSGGSGAAAAGDYTVDAATSATPWVPEGEGGEGVDASEGAGGDGNDVEAAAAGREGV